MLQRDTERARERERDRERERERGMAGGFIPRMPAMAMPEDPMRAYRACLHCRGRKTKCNLEANGGRPVGLEGFSESWCAEWGDAWFGRGKEGGEERGGEMDFVRAFVPVEEGLGREMLGVGSGILSFYILSLPFNIHLSAPTSVLCCLSLHIINPFYLSNSTSRLRISIEPILTPL